MAGPSAQFLSHVISACTAYRPISIKCHLHPAPLPRDKAVQPPPYAPATTPTAEGPLLAPLSCNYVEQTRAADGKRAAISLTFRDWSCWDDVGRPMGRGLLAQVGLGKGRQWKGGGGHTCSELLMGRMRAQKKQEKGQE